MLLDLLPPVALSSGTFVQRYFYVSLSFTGRLLLRVVSWLTLGPSRASREIGVVASRVGHLHASLPGFAPPGFALQVP